MRARVIAALADVSTLGPYFTLTAGRGAESGWRPVADMFRDLDGLAVRVDAAARDLRTDEGRVAASMLFQATAARFWSPATGAAAIHGIVVDLDPERIHWREEPGNPIGLLAAGPGGRAIDDCDEAADALYRHVVTGLLEPLAAAVRKIRPVAAGLLWGNAASALAGSVQMIAGARPESAARAVALGRALLSRGLLAGRGTLAEPVPGHAFFIRRSCCLYYRVPDGWMCGDCALLDEATREEQWSAAISGRPS